MYLDLPPERHYRLISGYCDPGKMAFENLSVEVMNIFYASCHVNVIRQGESPSELRVQLEIVKVLLFATR
jgi:hypothetical protein